MNWRERVLSVLSDWGITIVTPMGEQGQTSTPKDHHMDEFGDPLDGGYRDPDYIPPGARETTPDPPTARSSSSPKNYDAHFNPLNSRRRKRQ